ncbi:MAG: NifB/NifX family molybdenum-iron cluster-binding protein [Candidatus Bathyarchaeota archaeon]
MRIAVPTNGKRMLSNKIADTFSHAAAFTIITITNNQQQIDTVPNPGNSQSRGAGPLAVKTLHDHDVNLLLTSEIGPGSKELLEYYGIKYKILERGIKVKDALESLSSLNDHNYADSLPSTREEHHR